MVTGTTENDTREGSDAQESYKAPSPAPPAKGPCKSRGHGDGRRVSLQVDLERETVYYSKDEEEAPSLLYVDLTPHEQELYDLWVLFVDSKANTEAGGATTQDDSDAASFVDSSDDCIGSDTSESKEPNASHISSGDSAIVEESDVAPTLAEAIKSNNDRAVKMMKRRYTKQLERFHKDIQTDRFHRWYNLQMKKEAWKNKTAEEKCERAKQVKAYKDFNAAYQVKAYAAKVEKERQEEARKQEAQEAAAEEKLESVTRN